MKFILGRKLNMSQVFTKSGLKVPVTVIEAGPCQVVQVKTKATDGYEAVQIGFGTRKHLTRAQKGHQKDASFQYLREFRISNGEHKVGEVISASVFVPGDTVNVRGTMKGRGFTGPVKRHGFHGAPASHGHDHPRAVGSIGSRFPQHTLKGTRMAGRMGGHQVMQKHSVVIDVDAEKHLLFIKGPVPGARGGLVQLIATGSQQKPLELHTPKVREIPNGKPDNSASQSAGATGDAREEKATKAE